MNSRFLQALVLDSQCAHLSRVTQHLDLLQQYKVEKQKLNVTPAVVQVKHLEK